MKKNRFIRLILCLIIGLGLTINLQASVKAPRTIQELKQVFRSLILSNDFQKFVDLASDNGIYTGIIWSDKIEPRFDNYSEQGGYYQQGTLMVYGHFENNHFITKNIYLSSSSENTAYIPIHYGGFCLYSKSELQEIATNRVKFKNVPRYNLNSIQYQLLSNYEEERDISYRKNINRYKVYEQKGDKYSNNIKYIVFDIKEFSGIDARSFWFIKENGIYRLRILG